MAKLQFVTKINAPKEKVWHTMLDDATYREWTAAFCEGSYYKGSWNVGSKILFLGPQKDGVDEGMVSRIESNRPYEFISIEHLGEMHNGVEDTTSEKVKKWAGAHENYTFNEKDGVTTVVVDLDMNLDEVYTDMFKDMWPKALLTLKALAEK